MYLIDKLRYFFIEWVSHLCPRSKCPLEGFCNPEKPMDINIVGPKVIAKYLHACGTEEDIRRH